MSKYMQGLINPEGPDFKLLLGPETTLVIKTIAHTTGVLTIKQVLPIKSDGKIESCRNCALAEMISISNQEDQTIIFRTCCDLVANLCSSPEMHGCDKFTLYV